MLILAFFYQISLPLCFFIFCLYLASFSYFFISELFKKKNNLYTFTISIKNVSKQSFYLFYFFIRFLLSMRIVQNRANFNIYYLLKLINLQTIFVFY